MTRTKDVLAAFRAAATARDLDLPDELQADGDIHRCPIRNGKRGKRDGVYLLHLDGVPAGGFQNWADGEGWENWCGQSPDRLSPADRAAHLVRMAEDKKGREAELQKRHVEAALKARAIWNESAPCKSHPYLTSKKVKPHGLRTTTRDYDLTCSDGEGTLYVPDGTLVIPLCDVGGNVHSLEFVWADGKKRFMPGGQKLGHFYVLGNVDAGKAICVAEGFATAASIFQVTRHATIIACDCGNLESVAKTFRKEFPKKTIILCADDDIGTKDNPGVSAATKAAQAIGGLLAVPDFGPDRPEGVSDFNDLHALIAAKAVKKCINAASAPTGTTENPQASGVAAADGQTYPHPRTGGRFRVDSTGTWYDPPPDFGVPSTWLASQIRLLAASRDNHGSEWGTLIEVLNADGGAHAWAMPRELLADGGAGVWRELYRFGASIATSPKARALLTGYLSEVTPTERARCVSRTGWHTVGDSHVYVRPDGVVGDCAERVVFQSTSAVTVDCSVLGSADEWQRAVAMLAVGNTRVVIAISVAFAVPLLALADEPSGGLHLVGSSSSSKTTALKVAASVYGAPDRYVRTWRTTSNGLESIAAAHNDGLLCLDELAQLDPKEASTAAYMLANGQGKSRASRTGAARPVAEWRLFYLSSGETTLSAHGEQTGRRTSPGAEIRLVNVPVDAGAGMGGIEVLHGHATPAALADALRSAASRFHGAVGREWLHRLVDDRAQIVSTIIPDLKALVATLAPVGASGQVTRVARRFALIAHAGELATRYGLTGWRKGEAATATKRCFDAWLADFGGGDGKQREDQQIIAQVRAFFEAHGSSRFEDVENVVNKTVFNRAGFFRNTPATGEDAPKHREFLVLPESFRNEVCRGLDHRHAVRVLRDRGALIVGDGRHNTQKVQTPESERCRVYVIGPRLWDDDGDGDDGIPGAPHAPQAANHVGRTPKPPKPRQKF